MFWVDEIVEDILAKNKKDSYLITDWKTPSGHSHIGSLRGVMIHDVLRRCLDEKDKKVVFQYGFDTFDPMDGLPIYIDQSWKQYMGMPLNKVPAPDGKHESYADQYADELRTIIEGLGAEVKFVTNYEFYKNGSFNKSIKLVLDHASEIRTIYKETSGSDKGDDWYPVNVVCPNCGKIGTTRVNGWNGQEVEFECVENLVDWAEGCGFKGKISPFDGNAKMPWKVEWPAKWDLFGTDIEGEGKDHSASGGSREVAERIYREVFKKIPPYDVPYEYFTIAGGKMSSSKGIGATAKDIYDFLPQNILRFLCVRTKYKRAIDVQFDGDAIPLLYDEYDRCAVSFQGKDGTDLAEAFYYAEIDTDKEQPKYLLRFSKIANFLQMPRMDILAYAKEEKGIELSNEEKQEIENRIEVAKKWLQNYAPESFKFSVQKDLPAKAKDLSNLQKEFLSKIAESMVSEGKLTGEELHEQIHEIKTEMGILPRDAFSAIYITFLGKDSGPQAGWLLASLDHDFVINRLKGI